MTKAYNTETAASRGVLAAGSRFQWGPALLTTWHTGSAYMLPYKINNVTLGKAMTCFAGGAAFLSHLSPDL